MTYNLITSARTSIDSRKTNTNTHFSIFHWHSSPMISFMSWLPTKGVIFA